VCTFIRKRNRVEENTKEKVKERRETLNAEIEI
jgi:hypothetical protein